MSPSQNTTNVAKNGVDFTSKAFAFFRKRYPVKVHENVGGDIGYSPATLRKMEERGSYPSVPMFIRMVDAYGCEFLHAVAGWKWLDEHVRAERIAKLKAELAELEK